jgi:hypothetical protein
MGTTRHPSSDVYQVSAGVVALPAFTTSGPLQTNKNGRGKMRLFAKEGLVVRTGQSFDLIVPPKERKRLAIGWGGSYRLTWHLHIFCKNRKATWLVFPGGYYTAQKHCASLLVRTAHQEKRVRVGLGSRCK